jgi:uncharacterized protein
MSTNPVVHFEMPYTEAERVASFYREAFGWQMQVSGDEMGHYIVAETTKTENGRPTAPGTINGGFFPQKTDSPALVPSLVIAVDDIQKAIADVKAAGGEVLGEPVDIPGVGAYVSFTDTEGNRVSLLKPAR